MSTSTSFFHTDRWPSVRDALAPLGVTTETDDRALARDGQVRLWWDRNPVDLFFSYDPFHDEMEKATRRVPFGDARLPILGPEHLAICKAIFDRPKDWLDIEAIFDRHRSARRRADRILDRRGLSGPADERLEKLLSAIDKRRPCRGETMTELRIARADPRGPPHPRRRRCSARDRRRGRARPLRRPPGDGRHRRQRLRARGGLGRGAPRLGGHPVHLFFSYDELHAAMPAAVREVPFAGTTIPLVPPST